MILRFSVEGYRGFAERLTFDLTKTRDYTYNTKAINRHVVKNALVYGRNGVGKTNLGKAMLDARHNVAHEALGFRTGTAFLNADEARSTARFSYLCDFDGRRVLYEYSKNARGVIRAERLVVDDGVVYDVDESGFWATNNLASFTSGSLVVDGTDLYLGLSVLSYVCTNTPGHLLGPILSLYRFFLSMQMNSPASLEDDIALVLMREKVKELEKFLRDHGIDETLEGLPTPTGELALYMRKGAGAIPFSEVCSSGTRALVQLFSILKLGEPKPSLLFLDEFDAHYHHDLAEQVLCSMQDEPNMQVIATTHNTDLFSNRFLRPDCLFVLSPRGIFAAADTTTRELHEGHNLERLYQAGEFDV